PRLGPWRLDARRLGLGQLLCRDRVTLRRRPGAERLAPLAVLGSPTEHAQEALAAVRPAVERREVDHGPGLLVPFPQRLVAPLRQRPLDDARVPAELPGHEPLRLESRPQEPQELTQEVRPPGAQLHRAALHVAPA